MSQFDDYIADEQFSFDYPYGVPGRYWHCLDGDILVSEMSDNHIKNCMNLVGEDDPWYSYFKNELNRRHKRDLDKVMNLIEREYEKATKLEYVHKPLAYALYQVWKIVDEGRLGR